MEERRNGYVSGWWAAVVGGGGGGVYTHTHARTLARWQRDTCVTHTLAHAYARVEIKTEKVVVDERGG